MGRRTAATGGWLPQGACPARMHPPFSFRSCPKRKRAVHGPKEKGAGRAPVQWPSARDGGRRIGASADLGLPSGTLFSSAKSALPSRGGLCGGQRGARTHLTSFSFRAFRFATRCPGGRRGCCVGPCCSSHQPPASGSEKRSWMYPRPPRAEGFPKSRAFPSLTAARDRQPSPAGGRRSAPAQTDPPKRFFSLDRARPVSLLARPKEKWGVHCPAINIADSPVQWDAPHPLREQDPPTFRKLRKECILCVQL